MRFPLLVLPVLLLLAAMPPAEGLAGIFLTDGVFLEGGRLFSASASYQGPCVGDGVLTVYVHKPNGDDVRVAPASSNMVPDPCTSGDGPFAWVLQARGTMVGGGLAGDVSVAALQGTFQGGILAFHNRPDLCCLL